jgi:uncharacterized membrane protein YgdD (TMEM256/DUF423 family)
MGDPEESSMKRAIIFAGALLAAAGVMLGAFGAHALDGRLTAQQALWWQTAVDYQMWHGLGLLLVAALPLRRRRPAAWCLGLGCLIFSGTLYAMALGLPRWLGAVTPVGGILMIAGWLLLAWQAFASRSDEPGARGMGPHG